MGSPPPPLPLCSLLQVLTVCISGGTVAVVAPLLRQILLASNHLRLQKLTIQVCLGFAAAC